MANSINDIVKSKKVAIYIRVSTHFQADKDSLKVQRRELIAYSEMVLGIKEYHVFEDPGYSAKNTDRPDYQKMMDRLRTGEFSHLLVWKIDRISRNLLDFATMYAELKSLGVSFVSKNEQFDTSTAIGEAMLKIILVFAELERNMTSERVSAVMLSRANNGQWNGGHICYGYTYNKEKHEFVINSYEADIVKKIFSLYEENQSLLSVSSQLNESGIKSKKGGKWSPTVLSSMLRNRFYIGEYVYNKYAGGGRTNPRNEKEWVVIREHHTPIIEEAQFDRVNSMLERNSKLTNFPSRQRIHTHIFSGVLKCGVCGNNMSATLSKMRATGIRPSIYGCSLRRKNSNECSNKYISDLTIGPFIFNFIANILKAKDELPSSVSNKKLQTFLLNGEEFSQVLSISSGLDDIRNSIISGTYFLEFKPFTVSEDSDSNTESETLKNKKRQIESAISRLKSVYLFGDSSFSEKDFIIERQKLLDELSEIDKKLNSIKKNDELSADEDFIHKASFFVLVDKLLGGNHIDFEKHIMSLDPSITHNFIVSVIDDIKVINGNVTSIRFRNNVSVEFKYNTQSPD